MKSVKVFKYYLLLSCDQMMRNVMSISKRSLYHEEGFALENELEIYFGKDEGSCFRNDARNICLSLSIPETAIITLLLCKANSKNSYVFGMVPRLIVFCCKVFKGPFVLCNENNDFEMVGDRIEDWEDQIPKRIWSSSVPFEEAHELEVEREEEEKEEE